MIGAADPVLGMVERPDADHPRPRPGGRQGRPHGLPGHAGGRARRACVPLVKAGKSLEEVQAAKPTAELGRQVGRRLHQAGQHPGLRVREPGRRQEVTGGPAEARSLRELAPASGSRASRPGSAGCSTGSTCTSTRSSPRRSSLELLGAPSTPIPRCGRKSSWIQAAFLLGWALGRRVLRTARRPPRPQPRAGLTILTYALFTGLSSFAQTWWHLLDLPLPRRARHRRRMGGRRVAALGDVAAALAALDRGGPADGRQPRHPARVPRRLPARRPAAAHGLPGRRPARRCWSSGFAAHVPEPEEWQRPRSGGASTRPGLVDLFRGERARASRVTTILVCALSPDRPLGVHVLAPAAPAQPARRSRTGPRSRRERLVATAFFLVIVGLDRAATSSPARWPAALGYRRAIALCAWATFVAMFGAYGVPRGHATLVVLGFPAIGFFPGVFGLFTMYLPPLFPTLLRTTGAGFCYNIGRVAAASGPSSSASSRRSATSGWPSSTRRCCCPARSWSRCSCRSSRRRRRDPRHREQGETSPPEARSGLPPWGRGELPPPPGMRGTPLFSVVGAGRYRARRRDRQRRVSHRPCVVCALRPHAPVDHGGRCLRCRRFSTRS